MVLLIIFSLLLVSSAEKNETTMSTVKMSKVGQLQQGLVQERLHGRRLLDYPFDMFYSSKRRVPNTSDPLHNR
ncbi:hypothetical protein BVC80_491g3 [Macleaya cordata]|uniref:Uncharacterized protein n=1 Tax=Macleaya cordata TaxID=56857 RepID=A0A200Q8T2_MACCD|nr:hypothetical protein BVC80_491g3 [Macleaya cordata]